MSGGSYNYLYSKDLSDIINNTSDLENMADRLAGLGYATDAARETAEILLRVRQIDVWYDAVQRRMADVWKSVEWFDSCDWSEDQLKDALKKYRGHE